VRPCNCNTVTLTCTDVAMGVLSHESTTCHAVCRSRLVNGTCKHAYCCKMPHDTVAKCMTTSDKVTSTLHHRIDKVCRLKAVFKANMAPLSKVAVVIGVGPGAMHASALFVVSSCVAIAGKQVCLHSSLHCFVRNRSGIGQKVCIQGLLCGSAVKIHRQTYAGRVRDQQSWWQSAFFAHRCW